MHAKKINKTTPKLKKTATASPLRTTKRRTITTKRKSSLKTSLQSQCRPNQFSKRSVSSDLGFSWPVSRELDHIVNLERFAIQEPAMIEQLWSDYHAASSTATGFTIDSVGFEKLKQRGPNTQFFVHPIPRDGGYFVMLSLYQDKSFLVTYLEDYKQNLAQAQPYMTITLYDELQHSKDLVFVRSDIIALATITKQEADVLARTIVASYCDDAMYNNVFKFNKTPQDFNFEEYIRQVVTSSDV